MKGIAVIRYDNDGGVHLEDINENAIVFAYKPSTIYYFLSKNYETIKKLGHESCLTIDEVIRIFHEFANKNNITIVSEEEFKKYELLK